MASYYKQGETWTVVYRLKGQRRQYLYGIKSESLAVKAKEKKALEEQLVRADMLTPDPAKDRHRKEARKPLQEQIDAYRRSIVARGKTADHATQFASHITRILKMAGIKQVDRLDAGAIQEAAKRLIDVDGLGPRTANMAMAAVRAFSRWLIKRIGHDQLAGQLVRFNEKEDVRRRRRELTAEEIAWLLDTTPSQRRRGCMEAADRVILYRVALGTGFRRSALLSLQKASFNVAENVMRPSVKLAAAFAKNRKERVQPIRRDLAEALREWLATKPEKGALFTATCGNRVTEAFRADLAAARAAWLQSLPANQRATKGAAAFLRYAHDDGRGIVYADFHGLRHTGITLVVRHAGLRVGQAWADHASPVLTARYAHVDLADEDKALEALPAVEKVSKRKSG